MPRYTIIDHTADIGIACEADSLEALFAVAAQGMAELMVEGDRSPEEGVQEDIEADGIDLHDLLVAFLSELLFRFEVRGLLLREIQNVRICEGDEGYRIQARARGRRFDEENEEAALVIKAVTHHMAQVTQTKDGLWTGQVIFDT